MYFTEEPDTCYESFQHLVFCSGPRPNYLNCPSLGPLPQGTGFSHRFTRSRTVTPLLLLPSHYHSVRIANRITVKVRSSQEPFNNKVTIGLLFWSNLEIEFPLTRWKIRTCFLLLGPTGSCILQLVMRYPTPQIPTPTQAHYSLVTSSISPALGTRSTRFSFTRWSCIFMPVMVFFLELVLACFL